MTGSMAKVLCEIDRGHVYGEVTHIPYQSAIGMSFRHLDAGDGLQILRVYLGPLKLWLSWKR